MSPTVQQDDGTGGSSSSSSANASSPSEKKSLLPNWRDVDVHCGRDAPPPPPCSPFCHPLSSSSSETKKSPPETDDSIIAPAAIAIATAAPWSQRAFRDALALHERMRTCTDPYIAPLLKNALHDVEMAYRLYGPYCMVGSYNGGKDAVVIFHIMRAVHAHHCNGEMMQKRKKAAADDDDDDDDDAGCFMVPRPRVIYFQHRDEFPEVLSLLDRTVEEFDLDMLAFEEGVSFGEGLEYLVERNFSPGRDGLSFGGAAGGAGQQQHRPPPPPPPHPLAFVLGTRKDDPNAGSQGVYAPSSHYMPPFLRVNPILDWTYGHVWHFLRSFELPYCSLYDEGYTSLGTVKDTLPCPALKKNVDDGDGGGGGEYWPAYMLREWDLERAGRIDKKKNKKGGKEESEKKTKKKTGQGGGGGEDGNSDSADWASGDVASPDGRHDVTLSQTTSTASVPTASEDEAPPMLAASISTVLGADSIAADDDDDDAADEGANPTSPKAQFSSIGRPTVGLIVIGDELLKGMTPDSNIISAAKALRSNNIPLSRVSIVSDDGQDIADEIRRFGKEVDVIITSGGVGPTHDDITIKSIAEALGLDMEMHIEMAELLLEKMGEKVVDSQAVSGDDDGCDENEEEEGGDPRKRLLRRQMSQGQRKMAMLPRSSVLQYLADDSEEWPVLQCQNIYILPGVPSYFEKKIKQLAAHLPTASSTTLATRGGSQEEEEIGLDLDQDSQTEKQQSTSPPPRSDTYRIGLSLDEETILSALNHSVAAHPHVSFGSYPIVDHAEFKTIITLEGRFYNGGYTKGSQRLLEKSVMGTSPNNKGGIAIEMQQLFFSKEEMDENVAAALEDLKSRLPNAGILCVDSCDDLRTRLGD